MLAWLGLACLACLSVSCPLSLARSLGFPFPLLQLQVHLKLCSSYLLFVLCSTRLCLCFFSFLFVSFRFFSLSFRSWSFPEESHLIVVLRVRVYALVAEGEWHGGGSTLGCLFLLLVSSLSVCVCVCVCVPLSGASTRSGIVFG